jgi:hypothetical protein
MADTRSATVTPTCLADQASRVTVARLGHYEPTVVCDRGTSRGARASGRRRGRARRRARRSSPVRGVSRGEIYFVECSPVEGAPIGGARRENLDSREECLDR